MKNIFVFLAILFMNQSAYPQLRMVDKDRVLTKESCLTRYEPPGLDGKVEDIISVGNFVLPEKNKITVTNSVNDVCTKNDKCFVNVKDTLNVVKKKAVYAVTWNKTNGAKYNFNMAAVSTASGLKILKYIDNANAWHVFLIYQGLGNCSIKPGKACQLYRFEVHPAGLNAYPHPDEKEIAIRLDWNNDCLGTIAQPGGGDGEDDP